MTKPDEVIWHGRIARTRGTHVPCSLSIRLSTLLPVTPEQQGWKGVPAFRNLLWFYKPDTQSSVWDSLRIYSGDIPKEFLCGKPLPSEPPVPLAHW